MDFRFFDYDHFNIPLKSQTWRSAIAESKSRFGFQGRVRISMKTYAGGEELREYSLGGTGYRFCIARVG